MGTVPQSVQRLGEGLNCSRETRSDLTNLLQNCPFQSGKATLSSGTVVVPCAAITANSVVILSAMSSMTAAQNLYVSAISAGVSFTITDVAGTSSAVVGYLVI